MPFETNVFINCPFDKSFYNFRNQILFTILCYKLEPRISQNGGRATFRLEEIINHMKSSKFSIHDISMMEIDHVTNLPRFNMPFELGIDFGIRNTGINNYADKLIFVFDKHRYRYQAALSDYAGYDIKSHDNNSRKLIHELIKIFSDQPTAPKFGFNTIWDNYNLFLSDLNDILQSNGYSKTQIRNLPVNEFIYYSRNWLANRTLI